MTAEDIAREFHETYERLAAEQEHRSAATWNEVPQLNKTLTTAVISNLLTRNIIRRGS